MNNINNLVRIELLIAQIEGMIMEVNDGTSIEPNSN